MCMPAISVRLEADSYLLMGVKFWTSWGVATRIFKNILEERVFEKIVPKFTLLEGIFEA